MSQQRFVRRGFGGGRLTPAVAWIIGIAVACMLTAAFVSERAQLWLLQNLTLTGAQLAAGRVWTLVTTVFLPPGLLAFVLDILMLWMFVPTFERFWGTRRFLLFFAVTLLAGNLIGGLVGMALAPTEAIVGISPFILACIAAYGVTFGQQPVQFFGVIPIKGKHLAIGMLVVVTVVTLIDQRWVFGATNYAAMGAAWLMTSGAWQPKLWVLKARRERLKRKYTVLDGGRSRAGSDPGRKPDEPKRWVN